MVFYASLLAALLAAQATAQVAVVIYNCDTAKAACDKQYFQVGGNPELCAHIYSQCQGCAAQEHSCRVSNLKNADTQARCTSAAQVCYQEATSHGTTNGIYGCDEALETCQIALQSNKSLCASQNSGCKDCQVQEEDCRRVMNADQTKCGDAAESCFDGVFAYKGY
ncbi:hypothetical protein Slin15195_G043940 [Septoria linicola]|uniref:Uncharacterized protein n=1 Tax=Septoria linicola TaxID=215465 RepID=A0A9Q9EHK4_9PEZI|nr:hypothetical protein Slin14017_G047460 [Septoria linicola]USW51075.1 hypothetical protein Slin15195_G043940 [Septoria linicola]